MKYDYAHTVFKAQDKEKMTELNLLSNQGWEVYSTQVLDVDRSFYVGYFLRREKTNDS